MILFLLACASDIRDLDGDGVPDVAVTDTAASGDDSASDSGEPDTAVDTGFEPHMTVTDAGNGVHVVEVDSQEGVTYVDFGVPEQTSVIGGWEVSFERYFFRVNGGTNGTAGVEAAVVTDQSFDALTTAPASGWVTDTDDGLALEGWYVYDSVNHVLYAADQVYAIRNGAGEAWKLQFIDYYDDQGNTGFPSFRIAPLLAG
jgi:hypothetical protein